MEVNLEVFESFNKALVNNPTIESIIESSNDVYYKLIKPQFIAIFLFNTETFEPVLKNCYPIDEEDNCLAIFEKSIELGLIGEVMNSNDLILRDLEESTSLLLAPLISSKGALGFGLFEYDKSKIVLDSETRFLLKNFTGYLASSINGLKLENESNLFKNKIDQLVAVQTRELMEKKKEISEKVEQLKSSLLMTLPHEVRTPLNQILGLTDYLKQSLDEVDKEETLEILEDVHSSAVRLRRLFENYLYLSALTINSYNIEELEKLQESAIYSAESLIYETATNISYKFNKSDSIELNLEDSPLQISEEHFNKLIYELVDNAFKFGNEETKIKISSQIVDNKYKITIHDNGIGMPLEKIYMLDAYIQFDRLENEQQGSGLGLAIVKKIMDIYKGKIKFKSEVGKFTEVSLTLPIANIDIDDI